MRGNASYTLPLVVNYILVENISCKSSADNRHWPSSSNALGAARAAAFNEATKLCRAYVQHLAKLTSALFLLSRSNSTKGQTVPSGFAVLSEHRIPDHRETRTFRTQVDPYVKRGESKCHGVVALWRFIGRPNLVPVRKIAVSRQDHRSEPNPLCHEPTHGIKGLVCQSFRVSVPGE